MFQEHCHAYRVVWPHMHEMPAGPWSYLLATNHILDRFKCHSDSVKNTICIRLVCVALSGIRLASPSDDLHSCSLSSPLSTTLSLLLNLLIVRSYSNRYRARSCLVSGLVVQLHAILDEQSLFICCLVLIYPTEWLYSLFLVHRSFPLEQCALGEVQGSKCCLNMLKDTLICFETVRLFFYVNLIALSTSQVGALCFCMVSYK